MRHFRHKCYCLAYFVHSLRCGEQICFPIYYKRLDLVMFLSHNRQCKHRTFYYLTATCHVCIVCILHCPLNMVFGCFRLSFVNHRIRNVGKFYLHLIVLTTLHLTGLVHYRITMSLGNIVLVATYRHYKRYLSFAIGWQYCKRIARSIHESNHRSQHAFFFPLHLHREREY